MNPEQVVADLNRQLDRSRVDNEELGIKCRELEEESNRQNAQITALSSLYTKDTRNMAYELYKKDTTLRAYAEQVEFLKCQISLIEKSSSASAKASAEAATHLEQSLADQRLLEYDLGQQTIRLQEQITRNHQLSSESDTQLRKYLDQISELKSKVIFNKIQYDGSQKKVSAMQSSIRSLSKKSNKLIKARDDLIKRLNTFNNSIHDKTKREQERQSAAVQQLDLEISENNRLRDSLHQDLAQQTLLQEQLRSTAKEKEDLENTIAYFRSEDQQQQRTISSIQRQLKQLSSEERYKGLEQTVRHKTAEIEKLNEQARKKEKTLQEKDTQILRLTATITKSITTMKENEKTIARLKGEVFAHSIPPLDLIRADKVSMSLEIADTVFKMLRDIDSRRKAANAVIQIQDFIKTQHSRLAHITQTASEIHDLLTDITRLASKAHTAEEMKKFIDDVCELRKKLQNTANTQQ